MLLIPSLLPVEPPLDETLMAKWWPVDSVNSITKGLSEYVCIMASHWNKFAGRVFRMKVVPPCLFDKITVFCLRRQWRALAHWQQGVILQYKPLENGIDEINQKVHIH
jgi:hypothetical protein